MTTSLCRQAVTTVLATLLLATPALAAEKAQAVPSDAADQWQRQLQQHQQRVQELERLLEQQGHLLESLRARLADLENRLAPAPPSASNAGPRRADAASLRAEEELSFMPETPAASQGQLEERVSQLEKQTRESNEGLLKMLKGVGNFSFSGDLRVRYEPFFQAGAPQRHRERARLRFQVQARLSKELSGGLRLASGALSDPVTTNQTFTGFFSRKAVGLDRFWLTYKPERAPWLEITAGKFAYTWYRTELTFDNDLNPEGFSEKLSFDFSDLPLTNLTLVGFQLPFNELSSAGDSFIWGGQVQTHWKLNDRTQLGFYAAGMNFRNVDAIAQAIGTGALQPSLPLTNSVRVDSSGNIIGFAERFAYLDLIAELHYRLHPQWPLRLTLDFVNNMRASGRERSAYWAEVAVGQAQEKGDWRFGYTLMRVERDALIGAYRFSDSRASTNIVNHRLKAAYQVHKNVTLDYTLLIGRLFNPQDNLSLLPAAFQPLGQDPFLKRMQFDVIYKF